MMTSEGEAHKTTEFILRRKLRLQQVREQSKDIAKIIRQRAKVEKLRQVVELDTSKEKDYLQRQEKVVKKLEELYSKGLQNFGTSHKDANTLKQPGNIFEKTDLSRLRGKEAAAELKRSKQQKLDEHKKSLDRKIQAREAANVISREKSTTISSKLSTKLSNNKLCKESKTDSKIEATHKSAPENCDEHVGDTEVTKNDMATQWDAEILPHEWEPNIPALALPEDDSNKETMCIDIENNTEKKKRPNLFALSDEMPSSLRGRRHHTVDEPAKPSLTLVSEYIQNRALRLRETPVINPNKKNSEDLQNLKQTILRTRSLRTEGSAFSNICHVLEGQVIPVATWHAEPSCQHHHSTSISHHKQNCNEKRESASATNPQINNILNPVCPLQPELSRGPAVTRMRPLNNKCLAVQNRSVLSNNEERPLRGNSSENSFTKKKSVTMYNHSTKDTRDVPFTDERTVVRDVHSDKDAYSEALSEAASYTEEKQNKTVQDTNTKLAMTKQNVEKEYKDTMAFLNGLPKNKRLSSKPIRNAYKDDYRLHQQKENRQKVLQQEFKNIERNVSQQKHSGCKFTLPGRKQYIHSKSPAAINVHDNFNERDFQYSWMPVPESDGNLAVHTIPTNVKEGKSGNNVKFSKVDSYHEYRSRHKHTPPTKDTCSQDKKNNKRVVEAVIIQQKHDDSSSGLSIASDNNSSADDIIFDSKGNENIDDHKSINQLTDTGRIIIYKILDKKNRRNDKIQKKLKVDDFQTSNATDTKKNTDKDNEGKVEPSCSKLAITDDASPSPVDKLGEGIFKIDTENGDNISSLHFSKDCPQGEKGATMDLSQVTCSCQDELNSEKKYKGPNCKSYRRDDIQQSRKIADNHTCKCHNRSRSKSRSPTIHPSANTSATSFKTATNIRTNEKSHEGEYIQLIDKDIKEKGNFYIGATGFLKDDAYEVVIQLRKKDTNKDEVKKYEEEITVEERPTLGKETNTEKEVISTSECKEDMFGKTTNDGTECYPEPFDNPQTSNINHGPNIDNAADADSTLNMVKAEHYTNNPETNNTIPPVTTQCAFTVRDRSVITPFRDSYAIPCHVPKTDAIPRPATSSYTQTTLSSPNPRPVFIHMSSSTSTAYMSPPEVVLPNFFKRGYDSCNEAHQNTDLRDRQHKYSRQKPNCDERYRCCCRRCLRAENSYSSKIYTDLKINQTKTPPNTARNFTKDVGYDSFSTHKRRSTHSSPSSRQYRRCHNCKTRAPSKVSCKYHSHRNKYQVLPARNTRSAAVYNRNNKIYLNASKNTSQSYLNPMIKDYIKRLLSLNRENIKAIQIINQECSSVNTPASSIINVPSNTGSHNKPNVDVIKNQISLEQIKSLFRQQLLNRKKQEGFHRHGPSNPKTVHRTRNSKKKSVHKVKSLNISKKILLNSRESNLNRRQAPTSETNRYLNKILPTNLKSCSPSSASSERSGNNERTVVEGSGKVGSKNKKIETHKHPKPDTEVNEQKPKTAAHTSSNSTSPDSKIPSIINGNRTLRPINTSTQTSATIDDETNFLQLAEDKLHNMEKIADLTEKCTKRLSNLAKVLEEVRKNKSLAYSVISTSDSTDSDQNPDKLIVAEKTELESPNLFVHNTEKTAVTGKDLDADYESLLFGIPKPGYIESPLNTDSENGFSNNNNYEVIPKTHPLITTNVEYRNDNHTKFRTKPPPALLRMHLKRPEENVIPHELSTVIEVDSPLSVKLKNQSSSADNANQSNKHLIKTRAEGKNNMNSDHDEFQIPSCPSDSGLSNNSKIKIMSTDSSDNSKLQMMDLNQFNDIMLRPFISLQEYAQECYGDNAVLERESVPTNTELIEDISSLHSDGSLPDVVAELLKRKLITEPFKFDTASNINSTTVSSESTLSVLALSRVRKNKTKTKIITNKENLAETSDTLSISSNPDLENAFKKLGMGWASSTLKKTKERLALSSSSNTSSSSLSQFKFKNSNKQDMPTIVTDSVSSVPNLTNKAMPERQVDTSKNAQQQTSLTNSMTVKEFLNKELAKKITFTNKSIRNDDSNAEFVSLIETKIPDELKDSSRTMMEENSGDSEPSGNNNRARTSTPVQIFKSVTYHSSSSSNISNGLFSNADDLSSVKLTSTSMRYHSASEKDELTIPNYSLKMRKGVSDCSKTDSC